MYYFCAFYLHAEESTSGVFAYEIFTPTGVESKNGQKSFAPAAVKSKGGQLSSIFSARFDAWNVCAQFKNKFMDFPL